MEQCLLDSRWLACFHYRPLWEKWQLCSACTALLSWISLVPSAECVLNIDDGGDWFLVIALSVLLLWYWFVECSCACFFEWQFMTDTVSFSFRYTWWTVCQHTCRFCTSFSVWFIACLCVVLARRDCLQCWSVLRSLSATATLCTVIHKSNIGDWVAWRSLGLFHCCHLFAVLHALSTCCERVSFGGQCFLLPSLTQSHQNFVLAISTSNQTWQPAELKHITRRRKRN